MALNERHKHLNSDHSSIVVPAAGSAIMLAFVHIHPELWFISFFALVPFLWRLCHVNYREALALGVILASTYLFTTGLSELVLAPKTFLFKLVALNIAFALFGLAINRVQKSLGFDPLFVALLWFPIEYALIHYADLDSVLQVSPSSPSLIVGFSSLFGILLGSLVVVLGNSLVLLFTRYVMRCTFSGQRPVTASDDEYYLPSDEVILEYLRYYPPQPRAPPQSGLSL